MKAIRNLRRRPSRCGMQTFEWILALTILAVGVVGGLATVRNTILCEFSAVAECIATVDVCECLEGPSTCPSPGLAAPEGAWWSTAREPKP